MDAIGNKNEIKKKNLKVLFFFNLLAQAINYLTPIITAPYLSRTLMPTGVGIYGYCHSIIGYFMIFVAYGFQNYGNKEVAKSNSKDERSQALWSITISRIFLLFISTLILFILINTILVSDKIDSLTYYLLYFFLIASAFDITFFLRGQEKVELLSAIVIVSKIAFVISLFLFVKTKDDLLIYCFLQSAHNLLTSFLLWLFSIKNISRPHKDSFKFWLPLKEALFYFLPAIAITIYTLVDKTLLGAMKDVETVGYYEEAYKIVGMVVSVIVTIGPLMLSRMVTLYKEKNQIEIDKKFNQLFECFSIIAFPAVVGLYTIGRFFVPVFFGDEYLASIPIMYYLIPLIVVSPISTFLYASYYVPNDKNKLATIFYFLGALFNIVFNILGIYLWGANGAALVSVLSEGIISLLFIMYSRKNLHYKAIISKMWKSFVCTLIMGAVIIPLSIILENYINSYILIIIVIVSIALIIYGILLLVFKEEMVLSILSKFFKRRKKYE